MVVVSYALARRDVAWALGWTILCSLFFYAFWNIIYLPLLIGSMLFNYACGRWIAAGRKQGRKRIAFGVAVNLALLGYFKYTNFFVGVANSVTGSHWQVAEIALPLAISFFTFQQIAWLMDQYRGEAARCDFKEYICAVAFFPHLIAGPLVQYNEMIPQFQQPGAFSLSWDKAATGLFLIGCGVFKKIVIADSLSPYVAVCFDRLDVVTPIQAWTATLSCHMQIYFDFSGYSDIAIGSALLLGIRLPDNFRSPYKAASIREFWQRWNITLGRFFTRYLYIPLGGSRISFTRSCVNIFLVMFLCGLWHGAGYGFILWGIAHGSAMVVNRVWAHHGLKMNRFLGVFITFTFVTLTVVLFRSRDMTATLKMFRGMVGLDGVSLPQGLQALMPGAWNIQYLGTAELFGSAWPELRPVLYAFAASFVLVFLFKEALVVWENVVKRSSPLAYGLSFSAAVLLLISFYKMVMIPYTEFIYFNF